MSLANSWNARIYYAFEEIGGEGALRVTLASAIEGEDSANHVMGIARKLIAASTYSPSRYKNLGDTQPAAIKPNPGNVYAVQATNANAAVRYLQLHNKATAPAGGDVPEYSFPIPASGGVVRVGEEFFGREGQYFTTGISFGISTTQNTFTDSATDSEHSTVVHWF